MDKQGEIASLKYSLEHHKSEHFYSRRYGSMRVVNFVADFEMLMCTDLRTKYSQTYIGVLTRDRLEAALLEQQHESEGGEIQYKRKD